MKCPLCEQEMALGWWCNQCKMSVDFASKVKALNNALHDPPFFPIMCIVVILMLFFFGALFSS